MKLPDLISIIESLDPMNTSAGLCTQFCSLLRNKGHYCHQLPAAIQQYTCWVSLCHTFPSYSGNLLYPLPSTNPTLNPIQMYNQLHWDTQYKQHRAAFQQHILSTLRSITQ